MKNGERERDKFTPPPFFFNVNEKNSFFWTFQHKQKLRMFFVSRPSLSRCVSLDVFLSLCCCVSLYLPGKGARSERISKQAARGTLHWHGKLLVVETGTKRERRKIRLVFSRLSPSLPLSMFFLSLLLLCLCSRFPGKRKKKKQREFRSEARENSRAKRLSFFLSSPLSKAKKVISCSRFVAKAERRRIEPSIHPAKREPSRRSLSSASSSSKWW